GHPHAFLLSHEHGLERLAASDPPLGMDENQPLTACRRWTHGKDLLVLFTDGVSDARNPAGERLGEERILDVIRKHKDEPPLDVLRRAFEVLEAHTQGAPRRDDLTIVLARA
ncbi:MAG: PP2C family protein-serine/threonine phosphatase, partial [Deltaproteobacteria bacterium]